MKTIIFLSVLVAGSASALTIKPGSYESPRCFVEVTKTSQGGAYVEIASKAVDNSLQRDIIVIDKKGNLTDGPGLCFDEATLGDKIGVKVSTAQTPAGLATTLSCGGSADPIETKAVVVTNKANELVGFSEVSATRQVLFKKSRKMDCGKLQLIK